VDLGDIDKTLADISIDEIEVAGEDKSRTTISENDVGIVKLVNQIIIDASGKGCSDIHIETYSGEHNTIIRFRSDGVCFLYKEIPFSWKRALIARIKIISNLDIAERRLPQDGKIRMKYGNNHIDLRVATIPTCDGCEDAVLRILHSADPLTFEELNLSPRNMKVLSEVVNRRIGIYLVAGPTGSGKTTTLHSVLKKMNTIDRKIWTAEDPIEISQEGLRQVQMHPSIGLTFAHALRSFLRADPDVIMIGEMRDQETAKMGIEASLTGHLVLSTLHTNSAPETVVRLIEMGVDPFLFADGLIGVLAQRLARTLCKKCKEKYTPSKKELEALAEDYGKDYWPELKATQDSVTMFKPKGCENCNNTGFRGRIGLHEILDVNEETKHLIAKSAGADDIRKSAVKNGMRTLRQDGIWKIIKGHINLDSLNACVD
jgi:type II secretory ATPase GspE/PulE/Tfp pilus assembly ATPase PilB-like protein